MSHTHKNPHPGGETRATIVSTKGTMLAHEHSGKASLMPFEAGKRHESNYRWKIEVASAGEGFPEAVIIRNDHHPQKALDDKFSLYHSHIGDWPESVYWVPVPVKEGCCSPVYFKHKATGAFLGLSESGELAMESAESATTMWSLLPAKWAQLGADASWNVAQLFKPAPEEPADGEPISTAFATYGVDATVADEEVNGLTMKMATCSPHCVFVYKQSLADANVATLP